MLIGEGLLLRAGRLWVSGDWVTNGRWCARRELFDGAAEELLERMVRPGEWPIAVREIDDRRLEIVQSAVTMRKPKAPLHATNILRKPQGKSGHVRLFAGRGIALEFDEEYRSDLGLKKLYLSEMMVLSGTHPAAVSPCGMIALAPFSDQSICLDEWADTVVFDGGAL